VATPERDANGNAVARLEDVHDRRVLDGSVWTGTLVVIGFAVSIALSAL
jgi:hypothetical protein